MHSGARARFESKIDMSSVPGHWIWAGRLDRGGYGRFYWSDGGRSRAVNVARLMLAEKLGRPIRAGMFACHVRECRLRHCVMPEHLYEGTAKQNAEDRDEGGYTASGDRHWTRVTPEQLQRGDEHWTRRMPDRVARGERSGARQHPEGRPRGDDHWTRKYPERRLTGDKSPSRTRPECLARGDRNGSRLHPERRPRGEAHALAKFTDAQVADAIERVRRGETVAAVSRSIGAGETTVRRWVRDDGRAKPVTTK